MLRTFYCFSLNFVYIINRKIHRCLEIPDLFLVSNMISHSFAALTREISYSTLKINLVFPRTHVLFSIYYWHYLHWHRQSKIISRFLCLFCGCEIHQPCATCTILWVRIKRGYGRTDGWRTDGRTDG